MGDIDAAAIRRAIDEAHRNAGESDGSDVIALLALDNLAKRAGIEADEFLRLLRPRRKPVDQRVAIIKEGVMAKKGRDGGFDGDCG